MDTPDAWDTVYIDGQPVEISDGLKHLYRAIDGSTTSTDHLREACRRVEAAVSTVRARL